MANLVDKLTPMTLLPSSRHVTGGGFAFEPVPRAGFHCFAWFFLLRRYPLIVISVGSRSLHLAFFPGRALHFPFVTGWAGSFCESFGSVG